MAIPAVRLYINRRIGNGEPLWPIEMFKRFVGGRVFNRALSVGCGSGALERDLMAQGLCLRIDAFDGSIVSLHEARTLADVSGFGRRIGYFAADFNRPAFPRRAFDLVLFHQSAHHVERLERLYRAVLHTLTPDGVLYLDEYVGPSRFDWDDRPEMLDEHRRLFASTPQELRAVPVLPPPIRPDDPSEAFRSSDIEPQLHIGFRLLEKRPYGCGVLSVLLPNLRLGELPDAVLDTLIERDRSADSYYAILIAAPKQGLSKRAALVRYWWEPKLKRLLRAFSWW